MDKLYGVLVNECSLRGIISVSGEVIRITPEGIYDGPYTVRPEIVEQELYTRNKVMLDNLTVQSIPYFETTNPKGTTVIIGGTL